MSKEEDKIILEKVICGAIARFEAKHNVNVVSVGVENMVVLGSPVPDQVGNVFVDFVKIEKG